MKTSSEHYINNIHNKERCVIGQYSGWPTVEYLNQLVQDYEPTENCETHSTGDSDQVVPDSDSIFRRTPLGYYAEGMHAN